MHSLPSRNLAIPTSSLGHLLELIKPDSADQLGNLQLDISPADLLDHLRSNPEIQQRAFAILYCVFASELVPDQDRKKTRVTLQCESGLASLLA